MSEKLYKNFNRYNSIILKKKLKIILIFLFISLSILVIRLLYLQIFKTNFFKQKSENNRIRVYESKAFRGNIIDSNGYILANNEPLYKLNFTTENYKRINQDLKNKLNISNHFLKNELEFKIKNFIDASFFTKKMKKEKIQKLLNWQELAFIETNFFKLSGTQIEIFPIRKYPFGMSTSHVLGYVNEITAQDIANDLTGQYKIGDLVGKNGIEQIYDRYIRGINGGEHIEVNAIGQKLRQLGKVDSIPGCNIFLTIDSDLQKIGWDALKGKIGSVVVLNPQDGSILALISKPGYNPEIFNKKITYSVWQKLIKDPARPLENKAIAGQYPPGSTFKTIMAIAGLQEKLINPETQFYCGGSFTFGNHTFRCWLKKGHGLINLHKAIVQSCDVYFYNLGALLGIKKISEYSKLFGLGEVTGIALPGEKEGLVPSAEWKWTKFKKKWHPGETISASIGQSFGIVTPLQLANAYSILINNGEMYYPRLINKIERWDGKLLQKFLPLKKTMFVMDKKNIEIVKNGLWGVCNEIGGTAILLKRKYENVCGKTGTAQVVNYKTIESKNVEYKYRDHALVVCFAPKENPQIIITVIIEHGGSGSLAAAPIAKKILDTFFLKKMKSKSIDNV